MNILSKLANRKNSLVFLLGLTGCVVFAFGAKPAQQAKVKIDMPLPKNTKIFHVGGRSGFKTIEETLERVARWREGNVKIPIAICIAPGDYAPTKSLAITPKHASPEMAPLFIYAADFSKKPRIHGGTFVTGWKKTTFNGRKDVWVADASKLVVPEKRFEVRLTYNGTRLTPARWPNVNPNRPYTSGYALADPVVEEVYSDEVKVRLEDRRKWAHPTDGVIYVAERGAGWAWQMGSMLSYKDGIIVLDRKHKKLEKRWCSRFRVEHLAEELDVPGEWYYDPRAKKIYVIPPDGSDPNRTLVTFERAAPTIRVTKNAGNCVIAGLELAGGRDGIQLKFTKNVHILGCCIHDVGGCGMYSGVGIWVEGFGTRVKDCDIYRTGGYCIMIHSRWEDRHTNFRQNNIIENNYLHHCGQNNPSCPAIFNAGQGVTITHNLIHDTPRAAINGYGRFCDISYNRIRHTNMMSCDGGAMYDSGWTQGAGSTIRFNWISDVIGMKQIKNGKFRHGIDACGIYFDECTGGTKVYGNLVSGCHWAAVMLHNARWITVSNNVFISNGWRPVWHYTHQIEISSWDKKGFNTPFRRKTYMDGWNKLVKHDVRWRDLPSLAQDPYTDEVYSSDGSMVMGNQFVNNIIYYPDQARGVLLYGYRVNMTTNLFDRNIYWTGKSRKVRSSSRVYEKDDESWEGWQKKGQDLHTRIINPQFRNPEKGDFRLKPGAPPFKLGFKELPYDKMGLMITKFRPVMPIEAEGLREHPEWLADKHGNHPGDKNPGKNANDKGVEQNDSPNVRRHESPNVRR